MSLPPPLGGNAPPPPPGNSVPPAPVARSGPPVTVNVYTLMSKETAATRIPNDVLDVVGMSIYHAGVEVFGREYAFGMDPSGRPDPNIDGVFIVDPRQAVGDFKEAVVVGNMPPDFSPQQLQAVLASLRPLWKAVTYHILNRNCCHFAKAMVEALNPQFAAKFPKYVTRAADVGNTVVPEALVDKVTSLVAPPPAIPPALVNVVDIGWQHPMPAPRQTNPPPAPVAAQPQQKPKSAIGGLFKAVATVGKLAASTVGNVVDTLVTEADRRSYETKFPSGNKANLRRAFKCSVNYCFREWEAELFVATDCVCLTGPPSLNIIIPMTDVDGIFPASFVEPPAPRLPPVFEIQQHPVRDKPAFFIFRRSRRGAVTPIFRVRSLTSGVTESVSAAAGMATTTLTQDAMDLVEKLWQQSRSR